LCFEYAGDIDHENSMIEITKQDFCKKTEGISSGFEFSCWNEI
jgi:hypothetical protein